MKSVGVCLCVSVCVCKIQLENERHIAMRTWALSVFCFTPPFSFPPSCRLVPLKILLSVFRAWWLAAKENGESLRFPCCFPRCLWCLIPPLSYAAKMGQEMFIYAKLCQQASRGIWEAPGLKWRTAGLFRVETCGQDRRVEQAPVICLIVSSKRGKPNECKNFLG